MPIERSRYPDDWEEIALKVKTAAIHDQYVKAAVYLRLIGQFMSGTKTPLAVRQHEIQRLFEMRKAALAEARRLSDV